MENFYEALVDIHLSATKSTPKQKPFRNLKLLERKCRPILLSNETQTNVSQVEIAVRSVYGVALNSDEITSMIHKFNQTAADLLS